MLQSQVLFIEMYSVLWTSPMAQWWNIHLQSKSLRIRKFDPWVRQILWRRAWQPDPVLLSGEPHGQRSLAGYSPQFAKSRTLRKHLSTLLHILCLGSFLPNQFSPSWYSLFIMPILTNLTLWRRSPRGRLIPKVWASITLCSHLLCIIPIDFKLHFCNDHIVFLSPIIPCLLHSLPGIS